MRIYKYNVIATLCIVLVGLLIAAGLEYEFIQVPKHKDFYINIAIGIFSGGLLTLFLVVITYIDERHKHNVLYLDQATLLISLLLKIIEYFEKQKQTDDCCFNSFVDISVCGKQITKEMSMNAYFFKYSKLDKLVESIMVDYGKVAMLLIEYRKYCADGYTNESFTIIRKELVETYKPKLMEYEKLLGEQVALIIQDRSLKEYMDLN